MRLRFWHHSRLKTLLAKLTETNTSPHAIALGFAVGTFVAILPLLGLSVFVALLIALLFPKLNKLALFGAIALFNPITLIPIYSVSFTVGDALLGPTPIVTYEVRFIDHVYSITRRLVLGNVIVASTLALASFLLVERVVTLCRKLR